jgi:hypothetical protein
MVSAWAAWKPFPNSENGEHIDAPIGPGVYEVRHTGTGELIAFGHAQSVARALGGIVRRPASWTRFFGRGAAAHRWSELEYRTWAAGSAYEAKIAAEQLRGRRQVYWRRRAAWA